MKPPGFEPGQVRGGLQVILTAEHYIHSATRAARLESVTEIQHAKGASLKGPTLNQENVYKNRVCTNMKNSIVMADF